MKATSPTQDFEVKIYNGKVKIYIAGKLFLCYVQLDFAGCYSYKDDTNVYGIDIYLIRGQSRHTMEIYFKTKEAWMKALDALEKIV